MQRRVAAARGDDQVAAGLGRQRAPSRDLGLFGTLERGTFADIKRSRTGGKGLAGVVMKDEYYFNPFVELMKGVRF